MANTQKLLKVGMVNVRLSVQLGYSRGMTKVRSSMSTAKVRNKYGKSISWYGNLFFGNRRIWWWS